MRPGGRLLFNTPSRISFQYPSYNTSRRLQPRRVTSTPL